MTNAKNKSEVIKAIKIKCIQLDGRDKFAELSGSTVNYVSKVVIGYRPPTEKMLKLIGYEVAYVKVKAHVQTTK